MAHTERMGEAGGEITYPMHDNLYLNITNRCNLRCRFCAKSSGAWEISGVNLALLHEPNSADVINEIGDPTRYSQVVFCGLGEASLRLDAVLEISRAIKAKGAYIRLNTDGLANFAHGRDVIPQLAGVIDEVSISMNAQDSQLYQQHCQPKMHYAYEYMIQFVKRAQRHFKHVTVSAIDGLDGVDTDKCRDLAFAMGVEFRRRSLSRYC
ncbi:MAG: radical SAM protein [Gammaproteobacteria bacterium]|nr:radical SAM protein [Gammaproteobacteria bacterium]